MSRLMNILKLIIKEIEKGNPHSLILKGGTALSYYHLNGHRDSEDLDFDAPEKERGNIEQIISWFNEILIRVQKDGHIKDFKVLKSSFSRADRYHMRISLMTHKENSTKIDIDFRPITGHLEYNGELAFYSREGMLVSKLVTYRSRKTLKDIYDIHHLLKVVDSSRYENRSDLQVLLGEVIAILEDDELEKNYRSAFQNIDLKFKYLKERDLRSFKDRTLRDLKIFRNRLSR
ncbi:MAG: nucleotidyl transferase AbiEii/AbiGii toxin family protein [Thermoplasmata archaeon]|nr:nucleotidyl transferase AbiEii/AbiGii toxin family protein [Thermoplasmata archaeon]